MFHNTKTFALITALCVLILFVVAGCTPPVYRHSITHKYDAKGNLLGYEEEESIIQQSPSTSPMKVKINHKDKIEE